jgi:UDP-N-acetylmuramoylalanine--D-glutamate ligase
MNLVSNLHDRHALVLGLGISGMEAARLLAKNGARVTVRDDGDTPILRSRAADLRALGMQVELGPSVRHSSEGFHFAVLSPGIDPRAPLVKSLVEARLPLMGELEFAFHFCRCPIVAITGTNGKTTTTELIGAVFKAAGRPAITSGNIGIAFSQAAGQSAGLEAMVLEVSSFQLECIQRFRPRVAVHLNLTPDHLDRHPSLEAYKRAKWRIFENQTSDDIAVVNTALELPSGLRARRVTFDAFGGDADYVFRDGWLCHHSDRVLPMAETNLIGPHNAENLLAALAAADAWNLPREAACQAFRKYRPLPHRLESTAVIDGITYINDSKATNIDALEKALLAMHNPVILIAGGKDKGLDFSGLTALVRAKVKAVVLIGEMTEKLRRTWGEAVPCHLAASLESAVRQATTLARPGEVVLLSPGCSSYDMFRNYEERGDRFRQATHDLAKNKNPHPTS